MGCPLAVSVREAPHQHFAICSAQNASLPGECPAQQQRTQPQGGHKHNTHAPEEEQHTYNVPCEPPGS